MSSTASTSTMDVDPKVEPQLQVEVHPLAIVNMSDHFTRVTCGGSPLDPSSPVVGLLFGKTQQQVGKDKQGTILEVLDSDDIPVTQDATTQVSLHQAVFPQHSVVGWYRVQATSSSGVVEPTANDLQITAQLQQRHPENKCLFLLLPVPDPKQSHLKPAALGGKSESEEDTSLPLQLYQLADTQQSLIHLESWSLETFEPERIAIEHVVRAQPLRLRRPPASAASSDFASGLAAAALSMPQPPSLEPNQQQKPSVYNERTQDVHHSWHMLEQRLGVLEQFLDDTVQGRIPWQPAVMRQVQGLLWELGPMAAGLGTGSTDALDSDETKHVESSSSELLQQLAVLTKSVDALQSYADKVRVVNESSSSGRPGMMREGRGGPRGMFHRHRRPSS